MTQMGEGDKTERVFLWYQIKSRDQEGGEIGGNNELYEKKDVKRWQKLLQFPYVA